MSGTPATRAAALSPSVSPRRLLHHGTPQERAWVIGAWLVSLLASVGLGLLTVTRYWSGLPLDFGGVTVYITIYPPLLICLWWVLNFGWWWGALPAYLATLTLGLYAGMPWPWALLFAGANPLGFAVMHLGYRAIAIERGLRSVAAWLFYAQLAFVSSVFGSAGALVWCYTNRLDTTAALPIWQGWWLGSFAQCLLVLGPLLVAGEPALARWRAARPALMSPPPAEDRRPVLGWILAVVAGVLAYGWLTLRLGTDRVATALARGDAGPLADAAQTLSATVWVFFWVFALLVGFVGFFGHRLFTHWQAESARLLAELGHANQELALLARTDALTGLSNRRETEAQLQWHWQRARRFGEQVAVAMLDLDHFKAINDEHGHAAGDAVLRALAAAMRETARAVDVTGRWGGEEFVVVLPHIDRDGALAFAERLRQRVAGAPVPAGDRTIACHISLGLAVLKAQDATPEAWLKRADDALYAAKAAGRNRCVLAD